MVFQKVIARGTVCSVVAGGILSSGLERNGLKTCKPSESDQCHSKRANLDTPLPLSSTTFPTTSLSWQETLSFVSLLELCSYQLGSQLAKVLAHKDA